MKIPLPHLSQKNLIAVLAAIIIILIAASIYIIMKESQINSQASNLNLQLSTAKIDLSRTNQDFNTLKNQDQVKLNLSLQDEINKIHDSFSVASKTFETITDLRDQTKDTKSLDQQFAQILSLLSDKNYTSASAQLNILNTAIQNTNQKLAASLIPQTPSNNPSPPVSNIPPDSGYSQQQVQSDQGTFTVDIISADLNSTKIIVDTASNSDCSNSCPVLPLATYVSRNGAYAGINGAFFCPSTYPSCAGKTNSFDTLLMNKNKTYFNSSNNVFSSVPAAIFFPGSARFIGQSLEWGRDTSPDSVIANYPLLVAGGNVVYGGSNDPKFGTPGARCFIGDKGGVVYIGCVLNATMDNSAHVLKTLRMDSAMNLDEGGSTALWSGGYKLGPGRDLPDAVLFVKR